MVAPVPLRDLHRLLLVPAVLAVWALFAPVGALATERLTVELRDRFDDASFVAWSLAKTGDGSLWFATEAGLYRYDGSRYLRVLPDQFPAAERVVAYGDGVLAWVDGQPIVWLQGGDARRLEPPGGAPVRAFEAHGDDLWVLAGGELMRFDGVWTVVDAPGRLSSLDVDSQGVLGLGGGRVWALSSEGARLLAEGIPSATHAARGLDALFVQEFYGRIWRLRDGEQTHVVDLVGRGAGLVEQGGAMWATSSHDLARLGPGELVVTKTRSGPAMFDREGSLWLATLSGPIEMPAPETVVYTVDDGLPTNSVLSATMLDGTMWVSTWHGIARYDQQRRMFQTRDGLRSAMIYGRDCEDVVSTWGLVVEDGGGAFHVDDGHACSRSGGWAWMLHDNRLVALREDARGEQSIPDGVPRVLAGGGGRVWLGYRDGRVCNMPADPVGVHEWVCEQTTIEQPLTKLWAAPSGHIWLGTWNGGVWRRTESGWESLAGELPILRVIALRPSPRGGVWISGAGGTLRVEEVDDGWAIRERINAYHGLPRSTPGAVFETEHGDLWIATTEGMVHVPVAVRDTPVAPALPAWIGGDQGIPSTTSLIRAVGEGPIALEFTAHSLRDPFGARYRFRLGDQMPWSEAQAESRLVVAGMAAGDYDVTVQAKTFGTDWVSIEEPVRIAVLPPWYMAWWFRLSVVGLAAAGLLLIHRLRVAMALRLYAQRTRIAADLHDEVGSTLSAIRISASSAATQPLSIERAQPMFEHIADTSAELGLRLRDIVWCLRPESSNLPALARFLQQRARQLLPGVSLDVDVRCFHPVPLNLLVLRNIQLIGLEALHNVARHADATQVRLSIEPIATRWRLSIQDDGHGCLRASGGLGLSSMRTRAEAIGAAFEINGVPGRGTRLSLTFEARRV